MSRQEKFLRDQKRKAYENALIYSKDPKSKDLINKLKRV